MNHRRMVLGVVAVMVLAAAVLLLAWLRQGVLPRMQTGDGREVSPTITEAPPPAGQRLPGEVLMDEYGSPETKPIEDLVAVHRVLTGYFSVIKDRSRYPIGGNEDLAAALRGENAGREAFLPAGHAAFGPDGRLIDRWGTPLFVHPLGAGAIELRSAGPDLRMFSRDDLIVTAEGVTP